MSIIIIIYRFSLSVNAGKRTIPPFLNLARPIINITNLIMIIFTKDLFIDPLHQIRSSSSSSRTSTSTNSTINLINLFANLVMISLILLVDHHDIIAAVGGLVDVVLFIFVAKLHKLMSRRHFRVVKVVLFLLFITTNMIFFLQLRILFFFHWKTKTKPLEKK
ncbi:hypothetical protein PanWU01x14_241740, partial [Parasponia andersonii]